MMSASITLSQSAAFNKKHSDSSRHVTLRLSFNGMYWKYDTLTSLLHALDIQYKNACTANTLLR